MNTYLESNKQRFLNELFELIKIPSISAVKEYDNETRKAAIFLKDQLFSCHKYYLDYFIFLFMFFSQELRIE